MDATTIQGRTWFKWTLIAAGWTLFAVFFASESVVSRAYLGRPLRMSEALGSWLLCAFIWLAATPFLLMLSRRFPLERRTWKRNLFIHLGASFVISLVLLGIYVAIARLISTEM